MTASIKDLLAQVRTSDDNSNMKSRGQESLKQVWDWEDEYTALGGKRGAAAGVASNDAETFLSDDVEIKGSITYRDRLVIDGKVEGEIHSSGMLTIGKNAEIRAVIKTKDIIVFGSIHGAIAASGRCELKSSCVIQGDLKAARLIIEEGATFIGTSEVSYGDSVGAARPEVVRHEREARKALTAVIA
jgi:cytoskeletal protein CcmA (bactofilin family)